VYYTYVPRSIDSIFDRLEARNERIDKESFSTELPKVFEVVIYDTKNPQLNSTTMQSAASGSAVGTVDNFYYYRARSKAGHHDLLVSPSDARSVSEYESLRNAHFQAGLKRGASGVELPVTGEVWLASHTGGNFVTLSSKVRSETITFNFALPGAGPGQTSHTSGEQRTMTMAEALPDMGGFFYPGKLAKFFTSKDRQIGEITKIFLHSTDGRSGPGSAEKTINRFHKGPTLSYTWKNKNTGETIKNPPCATVIAVDGEIPHGTICHPQRKNVEKPVKTSIHYAVDGGGAIIQGALEKDICNHAGGSNNRKSIGIEMCGRPYRDPGQGSKGLYAKMYNDALLDKTAELCAGICKRWNLTPDRSTIIGHEEINPSRRSDPGASLNPGKGDYPAGNYWNWGDFIARVQAFYAGAQ
jgi:hypothetical protein